VSRCDGRDRQEGGEDESEDEDAHTGQGRRHHAAVPCATICACSRMAGSAGSVGQGLREGNRRSARGLLPARLPVALLLLLENKPARERRVQRAGAEPPGLFSAESPVQRVPFDVHLRRDHRNVGEVSGARRERRIRTVPLVERADLAGELGGKRKREDGREIVRRHDSRQERRRLYDLGVDVITGDRQVDAENGRTPVGTCANDERPGPERRTAPSRGRWTKLPGRDSNPNYQSQNLACCQLHHPAKGRRRSIGRAS
jgi:hypothetical protein